MARQPARGPGSRRSRIVTWVSGVAALALIGTIAVVAAGFDARETPREEPSVWAMRSSGQYARVNTLTAEIDTVRSVDDPSGLVQAGAGSLITTHGNGRAWPINPVQPVDLFDNQAQPAGADDAAHDATGGADDAAGSGAAGAEGSAAGSLEAAKLPEGTRDLSVAGSHLLLRTEAGEVYLGELAASGGAQNAAVASLRVLDPFAAAAEGKGSDAGAKGKFVADAAAVDASGRVALLSTAAHEVRWYSAERGEFTGVERLDDSVGPDELQLSIVDGDWVALAGTKLWRAGAAAAVELNVDSAAKLQAPSGSADGDAVLVADTQGLWRVAGDSAERVATATGIPAAPIALDGKRIAAWVGTSSASMWNGGDTGEGKLRGLEIDESAKLTGDPAPVFRTNGSAALLSEVKTGMLWTAPTGTMIPVAQWMLADPPKDQHGTVVVADVTEQEPPVAVDDEFGVRANEPAALPVLLNDYDPNRKDVLTIVEQGVGAGLDKSFGTIAVLPDSQSLVFQPAAGATGKARFSYRITDGVTMSDPATVTLSVVPDDKNAAPAWCPVEGCQRQWPAPELAPGGTLVLPILEGWVDPDGDQLMLQNASPVDAEDPVRAIVTADGRLAVRHLDPNAKAAEVVVRVVVADSKGKTTTKDLVVRVRGNAKAELAQIATNVEVGQPISVRPLTRVSGGSGSYTLVDASVQSGEARVSLGSGGTVELRSAQAGVSLVALTVRDSGTQQEISGVMRVTAVPAFAQLGLPPLRAFVRPLADSTVDVLNAVPGANSRALVVQSAKVVEGEARADVIEYANVRVSGSTPDGAPGRIGAVDVTVAEGQETAVGRITLFQVPDNADTGAIAVADVATVRAGSVVDIPVLENDVAAPGQRLVLHPEVTGSGAKGELAFASGNTLRYLAPKQPGNYTLSYTTYGASSPEASDVGKVTVTVLPRDANRDPLPRTLTVRMAPGETGVVNVPLSGVDPDGDRVRLVSVAAPADAQLTATVGSRTSSITVEASSKATAGVQRVDYVVRDEFGGEATGTLRIIVTAGASGTGAPVTYSDYVRLVAGSSEPAVVNPLENDIDPAGGTLKITGVVPNVPGNADSAEYRALEARLDTSQLKQGRVVIAGSDEPGTVSFRYTVRSSESTSTAEGLIVVQVSNRVGNQAPTVRDTVLSVRDRAELESGGVDVVTDRVFWATGDVSKLKLSVWGKAAGHYTAKGTRISGDYRAAGDLVPFKLSGTDVTGKEVASFGFLEIPPLDELRLTLKPGLGALKVDEEKSRDVSLGDIVDVGKGDSAEFRVGGFPTQRGQASCSATSSTVMSYTAGKGEPWADSCLISVKLTEQRTWTQLSVPIEIVPKQPVVELKPLTRTVSPGATETIDLIDMVNWQGGRAGQIQNLTFAIAGGSGSFQVAASGSRVTATALANAVPGSESPVTVTVNGAGTSQALLTLRVGEAAKDTPRGATVQLGCTVGSACQTSAIGAPGEHDPFAGKAGGGLKLVSVDGGSCAAYATLSVAGDSIAASWPNGAQGAGGKCTATFTVKDAQGRTGTGSVELDARGVPRAPVGVTATSAGASSVSLTVALSSEASHPEVSGVELVTRGGGSVGKCTISGNTASCTVSGLTPGERRTYFARATNSVGPSAQSSNGAETWAYVPPAPPSVSAAASKWPENISSTEGRVRITIGESRAASVLLTIDGAQQPVSDDGRYKLGAGPHKIAVFSLDSADKIPPAYAGNDGGKGSAAETSVTAIGAPILEKATLDLSDPNRTSWVVTAVGWRENGGDALTFMYAIEGETLTNTSGTASGSGLPEHKKVFATVSASNSYGKTATVSTEEQKTGNVLPRLDGVYSVNPAPSKVTATAATWAFNKNTIEWGAGKVKEPTYTAPTPGNPTVNDVIQCPGGAGNSVNCSPAGELKPAGLEPYEIARNSSACIAYGEGGTAPTEQQLINAFTQRGNGGAGLSMAQDGATPTSVVVSWGNERQSVTFPNVVCEKPTAPDPEPEGGADGA